MTTPDMPGTAGRDTATGYPLAGADTVSAHPAFPELEARVLEYWKRDRTFQASVDARPAGESGSNEFVFYDGPPFANGLPHYGHLLTGYVKDVVPRYRTMRGSRVERRFGWDTHGLPAEVEAERQLGIKHKNEITEMGVEAFNDACRNSVLRYTHEWQEYVTRQARWVDFEHDYKTLDPPYMESVMWAFKSLWDKGLVYEGYRVLWYCWRCETPLSATETKMDDTYRSRQDPAVTVGLPLSVQTDPVLDGAQALVWTTTPWTLPSNLAAAVNPDVDYVVVRAGDDAPAGGGKYLLAQARVAAYARELGEDPQVLGTYRGAALTGLRYTPPFDFFVGRENAHQVLTADYVTTEDGTGVVHIAPAFGEEDKVFTDAAGIEVANPVDSRGIFTSAVPPYEGYQVFDANPQIISDPREAGRLLRRETYEHPYPHCWRCETPLIQRAVSSWFVAVSTFKDRMLELNQRITWVPAHLRDGQFGKWLAGARDWSISRDRFWGSPIPVWTSDDDAYPRVDVYGSLDELERDFGVRPTDLHRPYIDQLTRPNPDDPTGKSVMRRVPQVLDCWFESGSMPFAQVHYPMENTEWFDNHFPGDFIVEYNGQTRGWFYTLHVLATALFDRPAFKTVVAHGVVLGDDGQKMSKSRRNYPDVGEVFSRDGSDAMRWFLMSSAILRGSDLVVTEPGIRESVRQAVLPLWNAWYFLTLYAGASGTVGRLRTDSADVLDRYALAKTAELVEQVTAQLDGYDLAGACAAVRTYLEVLTNWYIRRSRERFWAGDADAIDTLHTVLEVVSRTVAPLLPLTAEQIWRGLTGGRSVHLTDWPTLAELPADPALVGAMDEFREFASVALSLRKRLKLRVRQPLSAMTVGTGKVADIFAIIGKGQMKALQDILSDEVNVRDIHLTQIDADRTWIKERVVVNARAAGPRLGRDVQRVILAAKADDWHRDGAGNISVGGTDLLPQEYSIELDAHEGAFDVFAPLQSGGFVSLDTRLTQDLLDDGAVADLIRLVQQARKDAGLDVSDRILLTLEVPDGFTPVVRARLDRVKAETLATAVDFASVLGADVAAATVGDTHQVRLSVRVVTA